MWDNQGMTNPSIKLADEDIAAFCERNRISKLSLFGSVLRKDFHAKSDVDFLVEFEPDATPSYFRLMQMELELCRMTGREADLRTPRELSKYIRQRVMSEAETLFVRR